MSFPLDPSEEFNASFSILAEISLLLYPVLHFGFDINLTYAHPIRGRSLLGSNEHGNLGAQDAIMNGIIEVI